MARPQTPEEKEARLWAVACHLGGLLSYTAIPFAGILGPLVIWLFKRDEFPFVNDQGKEALNFQISLGIYIFISWLLAFVLIGFALLFLLAIFEIVLVVIAAVKAYDGEPYRYPLTIRFIR